jgi:hypothetical protein
MAAGPELLAALEAVSAEILLPGQLAEIVDSAIAKARPR